MKKINIHYFILGTLLTFTSCDDFLNTMPDSRVDMENANATTLSTLLVSAYPNVSTTMLMEFSADNIMDNGTQYTVYYKNQEETYLWKEVSSTSDDDPKYVWEGFYNAIGSANVVLESIASMGDPASLAPQKAEALMCRAYCHFMLANVFCKAYNPETADKDMGLPYVTATEKTVVVKYDRGTMAEFYDKIDKDIEAALPQIRDEVYKQPQYHFNRKAAYAFATRFNLFYVKPDKSNYTKVLKYAEEVLGSHPESTLRKLISYSSLGRDDIQNAYVSATEPANLLIMPAYSIFGRLNSGMGVRYGTSRGILSNESFWSKAPWGSGSSNLLIYARKLYVNGPVNGVFPKLDEFWEATDKTGNTGQAHIVTVPFTTDESLLCRAEAYIHLERYDEAVSDMNYWQSSHCNAQYKTETGSTLVLKPLTRASINTYINGLSYTAVPATDPDAIDRTPRKKIYPQGFTVAEGEQENMIQFVLHLRRLETMHEGLRWCDIKRYGIEVTHNRAWKAPDVLTKDDLRRAIQLPADVINAGLTPNPR